MNSNNAEEISQDGILKETTLEQIHESFKPDFEALKRRVEMSEEFLHHDTAKINNRVADIIEEEREQKRNILMLMGVIVILNIATATTGIILATIMLSQ